MEVFDPHPIRWNGKFVGDRYQFRGMMTKNLAIRNPVQTRRQIRDDIQHPHEDLRVVRAIHLDLIKRHIHHFIKGKGKTDRP